MTLNVQDEEAFTNGSFASSTLTLVPHESFTLETYALPPKRYGWLRSNMRYNWFSVYRRLNAFCTLVNSVWLAWFIATKTLDSRTIQSISTASALNLAVAVLFRQESFVNTLFWSFGKCPKPMPLTMRRMVAKVYHLGGIHSGAATAAGAWFFTLNISIFSAVLGDRPPFLVWSLHGVTISLDICLFVIIFTSIPCFRSRFHDLWEFIHRFGGWLVLILFWALLMISAKLSSLGQNPPHNFGLLLARNSGFWLTVTVTLMMIMPWLLLRKVIVRPEILSHHVIRLHFGHTNAPRCTSPRFTDSPLMEWHPFASIPAGTENNFSVLVSRAGDWTAKIIDNPPTELWTKGLPVRGVIHMAQLFKKVVLVATGSGIGPILSILVDQTLDIRIIWSTPDPILTFGKAIVGQVRDADPNAIIINTTENGRPDLLLGAYKIYRESRAEAVFIISNAKTVREVVYGLESRGVPAFGPIFDS